ncbi:MAG: FkbM family methyltransferase [Tateyamaria sp.]|uniref:FkbM family methyltransferase n=1 Tax=Tateyamaria sp. TaxID=1929288 RepID=UPI00329B3CB6
MTGSIETTASVSGMNVPASPFLNRRRAKRINEGLYESNEIQGAISVVKNTDRVLELGAGLGVVGGICAFLAKPERVLSFEANPALLPHIRELYSINGINNRIEVRNQVVVSDPNRSKSVTFYLHNSFLGSSLYSVPGRSMKPVQIPTVAFDEVKSELSPTVLIIDIEGGELEFLKHADLSGIRAVVIEFHPKIYGREGMQHCKAVLTKAGFVKQEDLSTRKVWTCAREI